MLLAEFGFDAEELASDRKHHLLDRLIAHFGERMKCVRLPASGVGKILFATSFIFLQKELLSQTLT